MMLKYIIAGIVGVIIYQIVLMIVYIATNENDYIMAVMGMLVPYAIWCCIVPVIEKAYLIWCQKTLNGYRLCWQREDGTIDGDMHTFYATDKVIEDFTQDETSQYFVRLVSTGRNFKSCPWKNDIYKGQPNFRGWDMSKFKKTGE